MAAADGEGPLRSASAQRSPLLKDGRSGIVDNAVAPGLVDTPWFDGVDGADAAKAHVAGVVPLRRVGRAEDIAGAVHDLAHSSYITGEVLLVDGGGHLLG
ncbi:SDR family oxidoreductase [Streptomyces zaomyceticus]|uniref:SDR family oxidoreductase n=1 Tax=Streptomyces zaomyceticus TaxID=68286 RepID=UPI0037AB1BC7